MGELAGIQDPTGTSTANYMPPRWPPPYPGLPRGLEQLSPREAQWWGHRYGQDAPYVWAPSGWGEDVPLIGDYSDVDPALVITGRHGPLQP